MSLGFVRPQAQALTMTCSGCGGMRFTERLQEETDVFEGYRFMAMLPARKCIECGWVYLDPSALEHYERLIAERLCALGARSEHALRLMRRAAGLPGGNLAQIRAYLGFRDIPATDL